MSRPPSPTDPGTGLAEAVALLRRSGLRTAPDVAVILGSGLGGFEDRLTGSVHIDYESIPGFPGVTVPGHAGRLTFGNIGAKTVLVFSGRFHRYEGHGTEISVLPVRLSAALGVRNLFVSNAAGGINVDFRVGDLMHITGWLSLSKAPAAPAPPVGRISAPLSLGDILEETSAETRVGLRQGTYIYVTGPSYETPAEIRAFRSMGADAVGMSTVPELQAAGRAGMRCAAVSLITNAASGMTDAALDHADIKDVAQNRTEDFSRLVEAFIHRLP